jgi:MoaA/NifB/PqqE/SkfB family radical SAM enzyme
MDAREARDRVERNGWRPRNCVWELTLGCNLRCGHCGSRAGRVRPDELSTDECLSVVDQLAELGCELVTLSGGEPTLRDDWDRIGAAIARRGIKVNMVTNGVYRTPEDADRIARRAADAGFSNIGVSIDGPAAVHDRIRGVGTFARVVDSVRRFHAQGVPVGVMTTIHTLNAAHLGEVREVARDAGASLWRLQLGKPMGSLADHRDWVIPPAQLLEILPRLAAWRKEGGIHVAVGDSIGYFGPFDRVLRGWGWRGRQESWRGCQAGMQAIGIQSDGGVKGCLSLQAGAGAEAHDVDRFVEASLRTARLADLWFRPGIFGYNRDFTVDQLGGFCATCRHASACRGGARCVTSAAGGSLWDDPWCVHRQLVEAGANSGRATRWGTAAAAAAALVLTVGSKPCTVIPVQPGADAGTAADVVGDTGGGETVDCTNVCCEGEYGIIPDDVWKACCEQPIDCTNVCCMCDYGIIPDDVWQACCAPCENACCECDYGEPPPPQCCP